MSSGMSLCTKKILLILTSLAFAIWIAAMLAMYFKTVYPLRHPKTKSDTPSAALATRSTPNHQTI
jgi:hypothetical protein